MVKWVECVKVETERRGVKTETVISINEEYEPLREALKSFIKTATDTVKSHAR